MSGTFADRYFQSELEARVKTEYESRRHQLASGLAADFADYRERVGYLQAMVDVLAWMDDVSATTGAKPKRDLV